jgi:hypothetical protein
MKKFTLMMVAGLFALAGNSYAEEVSVLTANDITADAEGKANLVVSIDFETTETIVGLNFSLALPEGVDIDSPRDALASKQSTCAKNLGEIFPYQDEINWLTLAARSDGYLFTFIDQGSQEPFTSTKGVVVTIPLKGLPSTFATGKIHSIGLSNAQSQGFVTWGGGNTIADYEFAINVSSGINDINATESTSPAYNLQGIRVNANAKGLVIRDGKKMVVK